MKCWFSAVTYSGGREERMAVRMGRDHQGIDTDRAYAHVTLTLVSGNCAPDPTHREQE